MEKCGLVPRQCPAHNETELKEVSKKWHRQGDEGAPPL